HIVFFHAEDGIRCFHVTGVQTCALPISGEAAPGDALPSGGPITERVIVGAAPDFLVPPVIAELDGVPVLVSSRLDETAVYDLATGEVIGVPNGSDFSRHTTAATAARNDGSSALITGRTDNLTR